MKRTMILCLISSFLGAVAAVALLDDRGKDPATSEAWGQWPPSGSPTAPPSESASPTATLPNGVYSRPDYNPMNPAHNSRIPHQLLPEEEVNIRVYEQTNRSVVNIQTRSIAPGDMFFPARESEGAGSGIVLDAEGHILTNFHVVEDAREVRVSLFDGTVYSATPIGLDPSTDVAVLKIDAPSELLFPVPYGDSGSLRVGQKVYAIGNPFALERTLTTGVISSLNRSLPSRRAYRTITQVIQIDAAINPGNSGGLLLDTSGRMIGMNTAIASETGQYSGVGFAIPVNTVARIVPQLIENGRILRANIGISRVYQTDEGLLIASLTPNGAAERAGLQGPKIVEEKVNNGMFSMSRRYVDPSAADLILGVDGQTVETAEAFIAVIESKQPGDEIVVSLQREGESVDVRVVLDVDNAGLPM